MSCCGLRDPMTSSINILFLRIPDTSAISKPIYFEISLQQYLTLNAAFLYTTARFVDGTMTSHPIMSRRVLHCTTMLNQNTAVVARLFRDSASA